MRVEGHGDQVISVRLDRIQLLGEIHPDVRVIQILPDPKVPEGDPWYPDRAHFQPRKIFLRIQHPYCFRRPAGSALCHELIEEFLMRFKSIQANDVE